jgi:hypothetical protein
MRRKDIGEDLMQDNETYRKARAGEPDKHTPREDPSRQNAAKQGYGRPEFERWTDQELIELAETLEIPTPEQLPRESLIDALLARELR